MPLPRHQFQPLRQGFPVLAAKHPAQTELDARLLSYELAFRMQAEAPEAVDLTKETEATKTLYGMDVKETATMGRWCIWNEGSKLKSNAS